MTEPLAQWVDVEPATGKQIDRKSAPKVRPAPQARRLPELQPTAPAQEPSVSLSPNPVMPTAVIGDGSRPPRRPSRTDTEPPTPRDGGIVFARGGIPHRIPIVSDAALEAAVKMRGERVLRDLKADLSVADSLLGQKVERAERRRLARLRERIKNDLIAAGGILGADVEATPASIVHPLARYGTGDVRQVISREIIDARRELMEADGAVEKLTRAFTGDLASKCIVQREGDPIVGLVLAQRKACENFLDDIPDQARIAMGRVFDAWGPQYSRLSYKPRLSSAWYDALEKLTAAIAHRDELAAELRVLETHLALAGELVTNHMAATLDSAGGRERVIKEAFASLCGNLGSEVVDLETAVKALDATLEEQQALGLEGTDSMADTKAKRDAAHEAWVNARKEAIQSRQERAQALVDSALAGDDHSRASLEKILTLSPKMSAALAAGRIDRLNQ